MLRFFRRMVKQNWVINGLISLHDAMEGILVTGGTGAGKSSAVMREAILNLLHLGAGCLVITAKNDEVEVWRRYCKQAGRLDDLIIFERPHVFNFLQYECEKGGIESARGLMYDLYDAVNPNKGKGSDPFWPNSSKACLGHAVSSCHLGLGELTVGNLVRWMQDLPVSAAHWNSDQWSGGLVYNSIKDGKDSDNIDHRAAYEYVRDFWVKQDDKVKGGIIAEAKTILDPLLTGSVAPMVNGKSTIDVPAAIDDGKIVVVGTPVLSHREPGRIVNLACKLAVQRHCLRTAPKRPRAIVCDEANWFAIAGVDALVQSVARSAQLINLMAFQNIPLLKSSLGGDMAETEVNGWLGNFQNWIACQNACPITNDAFCKRIGEEMQLTFGGSSGGEAYDPVEDWLGGKPKGFNASWHQHMMPILQPNKLATGLRKGGASNNYKVDAYTYLGGRKVDGKTFVLTEFSQR